MNVYTLHTPFVCARTTSFIIDHLLLHVKLDVHLTLYISMYKRLMVLINIASIIILFFINIKSVVIIFTMPTKVGRVKQHHIIPFVSIMIQHQSMSTNHKGSVLLALSPTSISPTANSIISNQVLSRFSC